LRQVFLDNKNNRAKQSSSTTLTTHSCPTMTPSFSHYSTSRLPS